MKKMAKSFVYLILMMVMSICIIGEAATKKVAVTEFNNAVGNSYGRFVSTNLENEVLNGLVQNKNYIVVERGALDKIFMELGLQNSGVVDGSSAIEIGKLSGADYTLMGSVVSADIMPFNNILYTGYKAKVKFSVRIVDNKTGVILVSDIVEGTKSEMQQSNTRVSAENLLNGASTEAAHIILDKMNDLNPMSGTIISVSGNKVYFDLGFDDGVKNGDIYTVYKEGKMLMHPVTGEVLGVEEETIGTIKISEVKPNYAVGEIKKQDAIFKTGHKVKR
ncbi:CsgG/HfaB family protein [uncultured Phascolarctobacterium sp.]|uniref:CsgG/HfaB family protein n=1 Tax=uncultured Phascolarctobacterium sp. TaxID=512296 RepID=UPI0025F6859C|nr:CsgG/HfaB family protein [uncultured Phascolarctobacterium sp.]